MGIETSIPGRGVEVQLLELRSQSSITFFSGPYRLVGCPPPIDKTRLTRLRTKFKIYPSWG